MKTEKEKFIDYLKGQLSKGLLSIHITPSTIAGLESDKDDEEALFAELNRMVKALDIPDPEVLGKYSL